MRYREFVPCAALRAFVRCYWTLEGESGGAPEVQRVLPDGSVEIIFHFGDSYRLNGERQAGALLAGQIWEPVILQPGARSDVLGVRFRAFGAWPFLRFPLWEAGGRVLDLEDVWAGRAREWRERLGAARDRVATVESLLLGCGVGAPAALLALSGRQYRRRFREAVGVGPKMFERIGRFQRVLPLLGEVSMAEAALRAGYFDQSHLVRDFRQFAGMRPSEWLGERGNVPFFQDALAGESLE